VKIKFLGTGSGVASLNRFHSSLLITSKNYNLLIDCGDAISRAILNQNINYNIIDAILISHLHADHYAGLPSLITQMKLGGRKKELSVFVHSSNKNFLEDFIFHSYVFKGRMNFKLTVIPFEDEKKINLTNDFNFISKLNSHLKKYQTSELKNKISFSSLSFLIKDDENSCIYTGDVGSENDLYLFNEKVNWFISEITHINPNSLINVLKDLDPDKIILTHIDDERLQIVNVSLEEIPRPDEKSRFLIAFDGFELDHYKSNCL
jgi:ribonuclease BN (tRNA processing enzyme)